MNVPKWVGILIKVALAVAAVIGIILGIRCVLKARRGNVQAGQPWVPVAGTKQFIDIVTPAGVQRTELPEGMNSEMKLSAEVVNGQAFVMEADHEMVDRRSLLSSDDLPCTVDGGN